MTPKRIFLAVTGLLIAALAGSAAWFRARVPPDCDDPRTVAVVEQVLTSRDHLPATTTLTAIRTVAGAFVALRFVCQAQLTGFDPQSLPEGVPVPDIVQYTTRLTPDRRRLEVTVDLQPQMIWEKVQ